MWLNNSMKKKYTFIKEQLKKNNNYTQPREYEKLYTI